MIENTLERIAKALEMLVTHIGLIQKNVGGIPSGGPVDTPPVASRGDSKAKAATKAAKKDTAKTAGSAVVPAAGEQLDLELDISLDDSKVEVVKDVSVQDCRDALEKHHQLQGIDSAKEILREFKSAKVSLVPKDDRIAFVARCLGDA